MKKVIICIVILLFLGLGIWFYISNLEVKFDVTLSNGEKLEMTYKEFDDNYVMTNKLDVLYGSKFIFEDKVVEIFDTDDIEIEIGDGQTEKGAIVKFKSGMWLFVSKKDMAQYQEKINLLTVGKKVKVTTYFTEKSNRGSFPTPTLMPYMDYNNPVYDYSKLVVE